MKRFASRILLVLVLGSLPAPLHAQAGSVAALHGRILDAESHDPLYLVEVMLVGPRLRTTTDADGRFAFENLVPGIYRLRATRMGYEVLRRDSIQVSAEVPVTLDLLLTRRAIQLEEVTVTPGVFSFMESGTSTRNTMSREDIESVPQIGEDVFRAVNRLPGLSSGDYAAHFGIRGGRHDETLILFDGLELYEPYHLKDFAEGAISIIDAETIDGVELMTGGFPAQFGNKRSGVFNIKSRNPSQEPRSYSVGLSFMNARARAMGPLRNGKGSWLVSARSGFMDLVFNIIRQEKLPKPRYHDVFAKLQIDLTPHQSFAFNVLHAGDKYTYDIESTTGFLDSLNTREGANNRYGNSYVWATLKSAIGAKTVVKSLLSASLVTRDRDGFERFIAFPQPIYTIKANRDYSILGARQDWTHRLSDRYVLGFGVDFRRFHMTDAFTSVVGQDPNDPALYPDGTYPVTTNSKIKRNGNRLGLHLSNRFKVLDPLIVDVGGRYDRASYTGDRDFSPRASAALTLGGGRTLRAGWGHYRQIQGIDEVAALNANQRYFPSELSTQWTAGLEQAFKDGSSLRVEGYLKDGSELRPVYRNWKGGVDAFPEVNEDRILAFPQSTKAKGLELYYDRKLGEKLGVRAGYALSVINEDVNRIDNVNSPDTLQFDKHHPIPQDQRHAVNLDCTYKLARAWSVTSSLAFHTGWPSTHEKLVPITNEDGEPDFTVVPIKIYGHRLPNYLRLDVRATRRWSTSRGDWRLFGELVNLTNHGNVFGYDYFKTRSGADYLLKRDDETWFTILPSIGVSWTRSF